ncbi:hypothetical protein SERLA73DRAFT_183093 [Serpula lacrymans var. lacrymans S7.3]|uniref:NOT2/NOT3/NOT5 C-terminal domain-containing protein n=2 Tax=Serpula lacrymans var. lacrymans TaxID=341189 RepID=F8Q1K6_SERL3|nr:hypothetical protein SERLA73DRAFT_183093 [Serpula lacrymans var. lacrymans S7.3]
MLNLSASQTRGIHTGFQQPPSEAEKQRQNYALKLNQASHAAWNSPNPSAQGQAATGNPFSNSSSATATALQQNGTHQSQSQNQSSGQSQLQSQPHLNAPPGVPPPSGSFGAQQHQHQPSSGMLGTNAATAGAGTGVTSASAPYASNGVPLTLEHHHPQTPAQQVLMSAADRWGLLGLLAMIKNAGIDSDGGLSSVGTDLGTMGLDMGYSGNLYSTFITPWADQSAAHSVEPDFHLPACYNVQPPPPGPNKAAAFSDETLFFMFYSSPRDALQEVAAQELWNRNWRYHKELRFWITKESGTSPSQKVQGGEQGTYTFWDPENWGKERKEMTVLYADLEEKSVPVFQPGPGLVLAQQPPQAQAQQVQQQQQVGRGSFQMGL